MGNSQGPPLQLLGLDLFHAMYAVGLAFGIQEISVALYNIFRSVSNSSGSITVVVISFLVFTAILLLIVRFFWSTGNIRRALERQGHQAGGRITRFAVLHLPALLLQGVLILFVCLAFVDWTDSRSNGNAIMIMRCFVGATAWNALWLVLLNLGRERANPERLWIRNNSAFVIVGIVLLVAAQYDYWPDLVLLMIFACASIASSCFDMYKTADHYIFSMGR